MNPKFNKDLIDKFIDFNKDELNNIPDEVDNLIQVVNN